MSCIFRMIRLDVKLRDKVEKQKNKINKNCNNNKTIAWIGGGSGRDNDIAYCRRDLRFLCAGSMEVLIIGCGDDQSYFDNA